MSSPVNNAPLSKKEQEEEEMRQELRGLCTKTTTYG